MRRGILPHLLVLVALLLVQRSALQLDRAAFSPDEGEYALQVLALADGSWSIEDPFLAPAAAGGFHTGYRVPTDGEVLFPYVQHPAWPVVLRGAHALAGEAGMYLVPLVAALAVPCLAWWAARRWHPGCAPAPAFWAAAASPAVVVNSAVLWAHAASAALSGLALIGAQAVVGEDRRPGRWAAATPVAVAGGVLLRSEGLLFAGVLAGGLLLLGARQRARGPLLLGLGVALAAAAAYGAEVAAQRSILGRVAQELAVRTSERDSSFVAQRASGLTHSLVGWYDALTPAQLVVAIAIGVASALAAFGALTGRRRLALQAAAASVALFALSWWSLPSIPAKGLFAAWPFAGAGVVVVVLERRRLPLVALVVAGHAAAIALTIYPEGGGLEWGGRFFSPITVPVAAAAAVGVARVREDGPERPAAEARRRELVAVAGATVLVGLYATTAVRGVRAGAADVEAALAEVAPDVVLTDNGLFPSMAWRLHPDVAWLVVDGQPGARTLDEAFAVLDDGVGRRVAAVGFPEDELIARGLEVDEVRGRMVVGQVGG